MTIHDEIVTEWERVNAYRWAVREVRKIMEDHGGAFGVELPVEIQKVSKDWSVKEGVKL